MPVPYTLEIMRPVENITVESFIQTSALQDKTFYCTMESYGSNMCAAVDFGLANEDIELFGDPDTCGDTTAAASYFKSSSFKNGILTDISQAFTLTHPFPDEGTFMMRIFSWNYISNGTGELQFAISSLDCSAPNIDIRERARDFRSPSKFLRSKRVKITGITDIRCPNTLRNTKLWTAYRVDNTTGSITGEVNITDVSSSINSELAFEPLYLPCGLYVLIYKVCITSTLYDFH